MPPAGDDRPPKQGRREGYGVVRFRADVSDGKLWRATGNADDFRVGIVHEPKQCNFAHCSIVVWKNDVEVDTIKPTSVRLQIREWLQEKVFFALPLERAGDVMPLRGRPPAV